MRREIKDEIQNIEIEIDIVECDINSQKPRIIDEIQSEYDEIKNNVEALQSIQFNLKDIFNYILTKLKIRKSKKQLKYLDTNSQNEVDNRLEPLLSKLRQLKSKSDYLENNTDEETDSRLSSLVSKVNKIESLRKSNEYYGALGELAVIEELNKLSNDYYLFNDLYLELNDYISFNGSKLRSSQIDHLVVGPTGVFVIETKNWSQRYVQEVFDDGSYTPYDQLNRAGYLVYRHLNNHKYGNALQKLYYNLAKDEIKVKSILAITGSNIPLQKHSFIKLLRYNRIPNYIKNTGTIIPEGFIIEIAEKLCPNY
ncbi:nuclease-related domain-containing protein [Methanohalophilus sp. RSK]|uniref:nuclease-related domain-containing protein n=1 Tax=Methanohalophilus sp. RSK TaxID=2485783 RepID=UPI001314F10D|nr:nuclease-related domain-containing protein [Methanohalophilus sp. RSK]